MKARITKIEVNTIGTTRLGDSESSVMLIGATACGESTSQELAVTFEAPLNVTELAKLKTLLDEVETRITSELAA